MFWVEIWKISDFFIWKFSFFGCKIFNIFEPLGVTLTLELQTWILFATHWLIKVIISAKFFFFFNPSRNGKVIDRTRKKDPIFNLRPLSVALTYLRATYLGLVRDTSSYDGQHFFWRLILKSIEGWQSHGPDMNKKYLFFFTFDL